MNWPEVPIQEVCLEAVDCVNRTAPIVDYETPYKMIRTSNIKGGFINTTDVKYVTAETYERWTRRLVPEKGDVVLTREAPLGQVGRITTDEKIFLGQRIMHYRPKPDAVDSDYLAYALQSPVVQSRIKSTGFGVTVEHARVGDCLNLKLPLPPLDVQQRIGLILASYDNLIENNRRRIELLEQSARLLYKEWFVHLRFPGHEHVKIVDGVPEGWENGSAVDAMDILSGGTPKTTQADYWGGEIAFFTPKDSTDSLYVMATEKTITDKGLQSCNSKLYPKDTVFITARGTVGKVNLAQVPMAMNQSCYALVARAPVNQYYLYFALVEGVHKFKSQASGAVFDAIVRDTFKRIPFFVPNSALIEQFTLLVEPVIKQVENLTIQNQKLKVARDLLLPRLMNGEIAI
ncbi:restriction endonuclease subunit S [Alicyclobacillaceae bacterium I2511]|nr:restriction endonuclease subunit S [Alicyclobacillaceae bacterium I2511]